MKVLEDHVVEDDNSFQDQEDSLFQNIHLLQKHRFDMADIEKHKTVGIFTIKGIQMTTRKALCNIQDLSEAKVEKIMDAAGKMLNGGFHLDCL